MECGAASRTNQVGYIMLTAQYPWDLWFLWFDIPLFVVRQHNTLSYTLGKNRKFVVANKSGEAFAEKGGGRGVAGLSLGSG